MIKQKRSIFAIAAAMFLCIVMAYMFGFNSYHVKAENLKEEIETDSETEISDEDISTRGIFTSLSLSIQGGNGKVWATVKNDLTVFPSTVYVIVELYVSTVYQEKHEDMTLNAINSTKDLNMGQTLTAEASTGGVEQFWQGRMRYKVDNKAWVTKDTCTYRYSAEGKFLDIL